MNSQCYIWVGAACPQYQMKENNMRDRVPFPRCEKPRVICLANFEKKNVQLKLAGLFLYSHGKLTSRKLKIGWRLMEQL